MGIYGPSANEIVYMMNHQLLPTVRAAMKLGLTAETLRSWRRRGIGPPYIKYVGGYRNRCAGRYWKEKAHGTVLYPEVELKAFVEQLTVDGGRLPRPFAGRFLGGSDHPSAGAPLTTDKPLPTEELQL